MKLAKFINKVNNKSFFYIFIFIIMIIINYNFIKGFLCYDTYKMFYLGYEKYAHEIFFADGRIFSGCYILIANKLNIFQMDLYRISIILSMLIIEINVIYLSRNILKISNKELNPYLVFILSFISIFNFTYVDILKFIESPIIALSILFYIMAAKESIIEKNNKKTFIYLIIAVFMYQGTINVFWVMTIFFIILKNERFSKMLIKNMMKNALIYIIPIIINYSYIKFYGLFFTSTIRSLVNFSNITRIIKDVFIIINNVIIYTKFTMPKYFYFFCIISIITLLYIIILCRNQEKIQIFLKSILLFVTSIIVCIPIILFFDIPDIDVYGMGGRMFWSFGAIFGLIIIYIYLQIDFKKVGKILKTITIIFVLIYMSLLYISMFSAMKCYKESTELDKSLCLKILKNIEEYEKKSNEKINKMEIKYFHTNKGLSTKIKKIENQQSFIVSGLSIATHLEIFSNRKIEVILIHDEIEKKSDDDMFIECDNDIAHVYFNI